MRNSRTRRQLLLIPQLEDRTPSEGRDNRTMGTRKTVRLKPVTADPFVSRLSYDVDELLSVRHDQSEPGKSLQFR